MDTIQTSYLKPSYLAQEWGLSADCIRDLFCEEPGVLKIDRPEQRFKRAYSTLRIPPEVAERVRRRLTNK